MNYPSQPVDVDDDEDLSEEEDLKSIRQNIRGIDFACRIVQQAVLRWMSDEDSPRPDGEGIHTIELSIRAKGDRPLKIFHFPEKGNLRELAENIVKTAAMDLVHSTVTKESYVIRFYGGNESRNFPLALSSPKRDEGRPEVMMTPARPQNGGIAVFEANNEIAPTHPYTLQLNHNVELVRQNRELLETVLNFRTQESKANAKLLETQQAMINRLTKDRIEAAEAYEEIHSKKYEYEAKAREDARKSERNEKIEQKLLDFGMTFVLPALAGKFGFDLGMFGMASGGSAPPPKGSGEEAADPNENPVEAAMNSFFGLLGREHLESLMKDGTVKLDDTQRAAFFNLFAVLQKRYQAKNAGNPESP